MYYEPFKKSEFPNTRGSRVLSKGVWTSSSVAFLLLMGITSMSLTHSISKAAPKNL